MNVIRPLGSVSKAKPVIVSSRKCGYGSDMDLETDSDEEIYVGHSSIESSPMDEKFRNGVEQKRTGFVGDKVGLMFLACC